MVQLNSLLWRSQQDTNLRGIPALWPNHTVEPPTQWSNWIDQFHLAIIAKENLDLDNLKEPMEGETTLPILEGAQESETDQQRKPREARNKETMRVYEHAEEKRLAEEKRKFRGMRRYEADKKVSSILYLAKSFRPEISKGKNPRNLIQGILQNARMGFYQTNQHNILTIQTIEQETKG